MKIKSFEAVKELAKVAVLKSMYWGEDGWKDNQSVMQTELETSWSDVHLLHKNVILIVVFFHSAFPKQNQGFNSVKPELLMCMSTVIQLARHVTF